MDLNQRCDAECWATVRAESTFDRWGNDIAVIVAKMAYAVSPTGKATVDFRPIRWSDVPDDHGGVKYPGDLCDDKPGTDVGLIGTAHPPKGKGATSFFVTLSVSNDNSVIFKRVVQVFGKRTYVTDPKRGVAPGVAAPAGPTPLVWGLSWGGRTESEDPTKFGEEPQNPIGRGFATDPTALVGTAAHVPPPTRARRRCTPPSAASPRCPRTTTPAARWPGPTTASGRGSARR